MSSVLQTVYASVTNDLPYHTLEMPHATFPNGIIRWVQGFNDESLGLESGELVDFKGMPFAVSLPERSMRGNQELQFQLDNVTGEALQYVRAVLKSGKKLPMTYRTYLESNRSSPSETAITMNATGFSADMRSVNIVADFHDFVNKAWPTMRYTPEVFPGLKYI